MESMEFQYCLFYKNDRLQFGWIKALKKNRITVVPEQGKEFDCAPARVEYIWKGRIIENEKEALLYLADQSKWSIDESEKIELDVIHELCEPGIPYLLDDLAQDFLEEPDNGWLRTALLLKLKSDGRLFQQKKSQFFARSSGEIQVLDDQLAKKAEAEKKQAIEQEWADQLVKKQLPTIEPEHEEYWKHFIHRFKNFVVHLEKSQEKAYFCTLFQCQLKDYEKTERKLLDYLSLTDQKISWGRLILERSSAILEFSPEVVESAEEMLSKSIWDNPYGCELVDQRDLMTYTVDNTETRDFDDALSWKVDDESRAILVHITDVASFVSKDSTLFDSASDRFSSLYTIKEIIPMFPSLLSEDKFSLVEETERGALTFEFIIDDNGAIKDSKIYRSIINVNRNYTYDEIDEAIEKKNSFWFELWELCLLHQKKRRENGSLEIDRHEIKLDISNPDRIQIDSVRENTPASLMIQELAILTNHHAARYASEYHLPCLFRNQPPYSISKELAEDEKPTLKDINIQPARISLTPEGHSALGVDCYLQVSSPIRRFTDLVNQHLLMSHLGGQSVAFEEERLLEWARRGEEIQKEFNQIERKLSDHWKFKYLEQNADDSYDAQLIRILRNGKAQVNLLRLQLIIETPLVNLPEDEIFQVTIDKVDAGLNKVVIRKVESPVSTDEGVASDSVEQEIA